jgi:hypothetical protein
MLHVQAGTSAGILAVEQFNFQPEHQVSATLRLIARQNVTIVQYIIDIYPFNYFIHILHPVF